MALPSSIEDGVYCSEEIAVDIHIQLIFLSFLNVVLAITAILGNTLILTALCRVASLHPPSKVLLRSLAATDLGVGIIEPITAILWMSMVFKQWEICRYTFLVHFMANNIFFAASSWTLAAISVDRLLALL